MRERFATSGMIALCALVVPGRVAAQHTRPVHVGVSGGVALVAGTNREFYRAGSTADLSVLVPIDAKGFSVRADLSVLHAPGKNQRRLLAPTGDSVTVGGLTARTATVSAVLEPAKGTLPVRPFLSVGGGVFRMRLASSYAGGDLSESKTSFAVAYGAGLTFPVGRWRGLVEAHSYTLYWDAGSLRVFPLTVGLFF